ncbi:hypothetical protein QE152_g31948 [Popillia japonica]|uniref:FP protein C-terminal domain-containing protein n=1 Tax=Popillia japonica TaxID=7064 RepID=A0AAW1J103_POPJA
MPSTCKICTQVINNFLFMTCVQISTNDAHRVAQLNSNIIVSLVSRRKRDEILAAAKIIVSLVSRRKRDEILAAAKMTRSRGNLKSSGLVSRRKRDEILAAAKMTRSRGNLKSSGLTVPLVAEQLFINEHLTSAKKSLLYKARQATRSKNYKFIWVKNGNIFCRKDDRSRALNIREPSDLAKII